jgi:uncharacterized integral membrane protein
MTAKGVGYIVAAVVLGVLLMANWTLFATPVELNLVAARVQTPLLVLMLIVVAVVALASLLMYASSRRAWTRERRTLRNELEAARVRAENEEESRIARLRANTDRELIAIRTQLAQLLDGQAALLGRPSTNHVVDPRTAETRVIDTQVAEARPSESPADEPYTLAPELIPPRTARR